jgi:hypothetical protein
MSTNISTIKRKPGWSIHFQPSPPEVPDPPQEFHNVSKRFHVGNFDCNVSIRDIDVPEGFELEDLVIEYDYCDRDFAIVFSRSTLVPNDKYEREMNTYNRKTMKYRSDYEKYEKELAEWNNWVIQEKTKALQQELEAAKELLRKHGKLP